MLDRSGEQDAYLWRALKHCSHLPRDRVRVAKAAGANVLELVEENDDTPLVALGQPLCKPQGGVERPPLILLGSREIERELDVISEIVTRSNRCSRSQRIENDLAGIYCISNRTAK
jgi:hypothetical protein